MFYVMHALYTNTYLQKAQHIKHPQHLHQDLEVLLYSNES